MFWQLIAVIVKLTSSCLNRLEQYPNLLKQDGLKVSSLELPKMGFPRTVFAVSSENTDFPKKLFNMKIFSINFVIKKEKLIFSVRYPPLLKNALVPQKFFSPCEPNFWPTLCLYLHLFHAKHNNNFIKLTKVIHPSMLMTRKSVTKRVIIPGIEIAVS